MSHMEGNGVIIKNPFMLASLLFKDITLNLHS